MTKVRPLSVEDVFTVARMLSKLTRGARTELAAALVDKKVEGESEGEEIKKPDYMEVGMAMFQSLFVETEADLKAWLANLIGATVEEFGVMPATTVIDVVEGVIHQDGSTDFFARVSRLLNLG